MLLIVLELKLFFVINNVSKVFKMNKSFYFSIIFCCLFLKILVLFSNQSFNIALKNNIKEPKKENEVHSKNLI